MKKLALVASHLIVGALGFAAGVYILPILIAPQSFSGKLAPDPDYKLYLAPDFVTLPEALDVTRYNSVVVWCERFSMFITAGKYR